MPKKTPRRSISEDIVANWRSVAAPARSSPDTTQDQERRERQPLKDAPAGRKVIASGNTEQFNVRLPVDLIARLKVLIALRKGNGQQPDTPAGVVVEALTAWIAAQQAEAPTARDVARQLRALAQDLERRT